MQDWFWFVSVYTMAELKLTGNCLKGSRPLLSFDKHFDETPHYKVLKELLIQVRFFKPFSGISTSHITFCSMWNSGLFQIVSGIAMSLKSCHAATSSVHKLGDSRVICDVTIPHGIWMVPNCVETLLNSSVFCFRFLELLMVILRPSLLLTMFLLFQSLTTVYGSVIIRYWQRMEL